MKKYQIIYADPPWQFGSKKYQDGWREFDKLEESQYNTMTIDELNKLKVKKIADDNSICFMWVTDSHLKEGIEVMESWWFEYKTIAFNWIKQYESWKECVNFAPWTLKSWEICLLGTRWTMGKYKIKNNIQGLIKSVRGKHSQKPEEARDRIVELFWDLPRIELFARNKTDWWHVWWNEVESDIILVAPS